MHYLLYIKLQELYQDTIVIPSTELNQGFTSRL